MQTFPLASAHLLVLESEIFAGNRKKERKKERKNCISTIVGYLMPNTVYILYIYIYTLNIHDLVGLCFMAYQP